VPTILRIPRYFSCSDKTVPPRRVLRREPPALPLRCRGRHDQLLVVRLLPPPATMTRCSPVARNHATAGIVDFLFVADAPGRNGIFMGLSEKEWAPLYASALIGRRVSCGESDGPFLEGAAGPQPVVAPSTYRSRHGLMCRSLMPRISSPCRQVIFFAIACNITSCTFIARSIAALE